MKWFLLFVPLLWLLTACSDGPDSDMDDELESVTPVEELYNEAMDELQSQNWKSARKDFEEVERVHPTSQWAKHAQVMNAYAAYENQDYVETIAILNRFIRLYPGDERIPYAYYLIALSYYEQISDVGRDQSMTDQALSALKDVIRRFPDTDYARDAAVKRDLTVDHLAGKEMEIGRYYLTRSEYLAGIKRFQRVIDRYQGTTHTPEALHRLVEGYLKLGVITEAKKYAAVLGYNYPASEWYKDSYKLLGGDESSQTSDLQAPEGESEGWLGIF